MSTQTQIIELAGEQVELLPEAAIFWPAAHTLFITDLHFGKAATFRAAAIGVPEGSTNADLARLDTLLERTGATCLAMLGDLLHARNSRDEATLIAVSNWRARRLDLEVLLVRGNHDRHAGDPPVEWNIRCVNGPYRMGPFALNHEPAHAPTGYVLAGHVHPAVQLSGPGQQRERLPAFIFGPRIGLMPAFGSFTGTALVRPTRGDRVYVIAAQTVVGPL